MDIFEGKNLTGSEEGFRLGHQLFCAGRKIYNAHQLQPEMRGPLFDLFLVTKGTF